MSLRLSHSRIGLAASIFIFEALFVFVAFVGHDSAGADEMRRRPNILVAISDDQSWIHTSVSGCRTIATPNFDRVAKEGVLFNNAISASPGCSPSRASILTGRYPWQLEQAGTHASSFLSEVLRLP